MHLLSKQLFPDLNHSLHRAPIFKLSLPRFLSFILKLLTKYVSDVVKLRNFYMPGFDSFAVRSRRNNINAKMQWHALPTLTRTSGKSFSPFQRFRLNVTLDLERVWSDNGCGRFYSESFVFLSLLEVYKFITEPDTFIRCVLCYGTTSYFEFYFTRLNFLLLYYFILNNLKNSTLFLRISFGFVNAKLVTRPKTSFRVRWEMRSNSSKHKKLTYVLIRNSNVYPILQ